MQQLQLDDNVARTSVNFMGCYAAFHAMKMADAICRADDEATVLIVMVELCSLHFLTHGMADPKWQEFYGEFKNYIVSSHREIMKRHDVS